MSKTYHCYDVSHSYRGTVVSIELGCEVAGEGGLIVMPYGDHERQWYVRDGLAYLMYKPGQAQPGGISNRYCLKCGGDKGIGDCSCKRVA